MACFLILDTMLGYLYSHVIFIAIFQVETITLASRYYYSHLGKETVI